MIDVWRWTDEERHRGRDWSSGPWDEEPDKMSWTDEATGRPCLIVRGPLGALCGYVAVDPGHPLHGVDCFGEDGALIPDEVHDATHGGLTYADSCAHGDDETRGICHVPQPGQPDDVWWFGFDCGHGGDLIPGLDAQLCDVSAPFHPPISGLRDVYRTVDYVADRCHALAAALVAVRGVR